MATQPQAFYRLWQDDQIRETLFQMLPKEDICAMRLANSACCNLVTKRLFLRTTLTFTASTFTKATRVQALSRIGHHVEHLTFVLAHSDATFLPPLIHPSTGREIAFLYTPHTSMGSVLARPKYGNSELGEILTQQYPPLFHAATNVPSFINAMKHLPNMRHLTIRCSGQDPKERYRRDIVDYALISLRISVERAPLHKLAKLTLSGVHPSAFNYLRHVPGFGCRPSAARRWQQIRKLYLSVESWDFYGPSPGLDHLKIMDDYIRHFAPNLDKLSFTWMGCKGPCPLALSGDPLFAPPRSSKKLFNEVTSPMSPLPPAPCREPIQFPKLRHMTVRNATMNVPQLRGLVASHRASVREFDFENVALINGGSWDEALAPLMDQSSDHSSDVWSRHSLGGSGSEAESFRTEASSSASNEDVELQSPSAAVAAASRELLDLDVEGLENFLGLGSELAAPQPDEDDDDGGLASDIAAAKEASLSFSTKLKKKRIRRRRRKHHKDDDPGDSDGEREHRRHRHPHKHSQSSEPTHQHRSRSRSRSRPRHRKNSAEDLPSPHRSPRHPFAHLTPPQPEVLDDNNDDNDDVFRPTSPSPLNISHPIHSAEPLPMLLQPTVYNPTNPTGTDASASDDGLSTVQRSLELEEAHRRLAEDAEARKSVLKKAKEAVLAKLSREFQRRMGKEVSSAGGGRCAGDGLRLRERLFGESLVSVVPDHRSLESNSTLVPLMFSRG